MNGKIDLGVQREFGSFEGLITLPDGRGSEMIVDTKRPDVSDHRKTYFSERPADLNRHGTEGMDQSRGYGGRRSRTGIRSPSEGATAT